jgi:hypothetical protein
MNGDATEPDTTLYRVALDLEVGMNDAMAETAFDARFVEGVEQIGMDQYQVTIGLRAPNVGEAYRRAANYADAVAEASLLQPDDIVLGATIYGPDGPVTFD